MPLLTARPSSMAYRSDAPCPADEHLLVTLVTTWVLATGRRPPAARPGDLTAEELIEFWADDRL
ncbi:hypothetical protein MF672_034050 [Actinomadura sp. ATCC 31491]|uniref:Uncharacterized protein n=1 Tax=Actinomadura luzonensis TaxID=2805427 RepID=A0ABT0G2L9_9ACTN|nr:hypothetical protein [Actinomadura luzonensis]MCK2218782.1 hypothetical protein [Actinomadura luzonensis]